MIRQEFATIDVLLVEDDPGDVAITREAFEENKVQNRLHVVNNGVDVVFVSVGTVVIIVIIITVGDEIFSFRFTVIFLHVLRGNKSNRLAGEKKKKKKKKKKI